MVQNESKNNLFKKILAAVKPVDDALNAMQDTATPVWTNLDILTDLYMSHDLAAIAEDRIHYYSYEEGYYAGYFGDFGYQELYGEKGLIVENAKELAIEREIQWLLTRKNN